jgi:hypothetical protein
MTSLILAGLILTLAACSGGSEEKSASESTAADDVGSTDSGSTPAGADGGTGGTDVPAGTDGGTTGGGSSGSSDGGSSDAGGTGGTSTGSPTEPIPLTIAGTPASSVTAGAEFRFVPSVTGATAGTSLTFSVVNLPGWAAFDPGSGAIAGVPQPADVGTFPGIVVTATDGTRSASTAEFTIEVVAMALGSAELSWTAPTENADGTALTDLAGFRVYWGQAADELSFSASIDNPSVSMYLIGNLTPALWFFAVTAIDSTGQESVLSEVVSAQIG